MFILFIGFYAVQQVGIKLESKSDINSSEIILISDGDTTLQVKDVDVSYNTNELKIQDFTMEVRRVEHASSTLVTIYDMGSLLTYLDTNSIDWTYATEQE